MNSYFLIGNVGIRIWWDPRFWSIHSFKDGGRRATCFGPVEFYTGE